MFIPIIILFSGREDSTQSCMYRLGCCCFYYPNISFMFILSMYRLKHRNFDTVSQPAWERFTELQNWQGVEIKGAINN